MGTLKLVLATENQNKIREFQQILGSEFQLVSLAELPGAGPLPAEGLESYKINASQKALFAGEISETLSLGDDSGFEVEALQGRPGVASARYGNIKNPPDQCRMILKELEGQGNRRARFVCVLALFVPESGSVKYFQGVVDGQVATELRGENGFGYDPIFIPNEMKEKTFAELNAEEKNRISHRSRAIVSLRNYLLSRAKS